MSKVSDCKCQRPRTSSDGFGINTSCSLLTRLQVGKETRAFLKLRTPYLSIDWRRLPHFGTRMSKGF